jgi:hypothetical protein
LSGRIGVGGSARGTPATPHVAGVSLRGPNDSTGEVPDQPTSTAQTADIAPAQPRRRDARRGRRPERKTRSRQNRTVTRSEAIAYSHILIAAFQETIDYANVKQRNAKPPALWIDDNTYIEHVKSLVLELKRLNDLLEKRKPTKRETINITHHINVFLGSYAKHLGIGGAWLTIGVFAVLLEKIGLGPNVTSDIWSHMHK